MDGWATRPDDPFAADGGAGGGASPAGVTDTAAAGEDGSDPPASADAALAQGFETVRAWPVSRQNRWNSMSSGSPAARAGSSGGGRRHV